MTRDDIIRMAKEASGQRQERQVQRPCKAMGYTALPPIDGGVPWDQTVRLQTAEGADAMTDRELLELAAKAAGIEVWFPRMADGKGGVLEPCHTLRNGQTEEWNPLTDDGDALRLAVKLNMSINIPANSKIRADVISYLDLSVCIREIGDDPYAAIRRAIVRAAAEMGRDMK